MGFDLGDLAVRQGEKRGGCEGVGHDFELAAFLEYNAAEQGAAVFFGDEVGVVLIGDDLGGVDDVFHQVAEGVAVGGASEVGADTAAVAVEAVAGEAHGGAEHGLAMFEVAAFEAAFGQGDGFIEGPSATGATGGGESGKGFGFVGGGELVHGGAFGFWCEVGEGFGADVFDEAFEAVATFPGAGAGEPGEESVAEIRGPASGGAAQGEHSGNLGAVGAGGGGGLGGAGVAFVALEHGGGGDVLPVVLGGGHLGEGLGRSGGGVEEDEEIEQFAVDGGVARGVERVEFFGDSHADFGVGFAEAGEDEGERAQGSEGLLAGKGVAFESAHGFEHFDLQFGVLGGDGLGGVDGGTGGGFAFDDQLGAMGSAGEGDQGFHQGLRSGLGESAGSP